MDEPNPELIVAAAQGDRGAFAELVRAYQSVIWRFLVGLLGDRALAEDVTQDTLLRVYLKLPTFAYRSKFSTWVLAIARNAGIDAMRKRGRSQVLTRSVTDLKPQMTTPSPSTRVDVEMAIATLPPKLREAFVVVEIVGLRYEEAAEVLRIPVGTVKSRVFNARRHLIAELGDIANEA